MCPRSDRDLRSADQINLSLTDVEIDIDTDGVVTITSKNKTAPIKSGIKYGNMKISMSGGIATPDPTFFGGFIALPIDPITGMIQAGNQLNVISPPKDI